MWTAIRALHDRIVTYEELAEDARHAGRDATFKLFRAKADEARTQVGLAREFMASVVAAS